MKVIALVGFAGVGKDTAAGAMASALQDKGSEARIDSFAAPIREISQAMGLEPFDRTKKEAVRTILWDEFDASLFDAIEEVLGKSLSDNDRALLYTFTNEALQPKKYQAPHFGTTENFIDISPREFMQVLGTEGGQAVRPQLWVELLAARTAEGYTIVPDCRFEHELEVVDFVVHVVRPGFSRINDHKSEDLAEAFFKGDAPPVGVYITLVNDGDTHDLRFTASSVALTLL